MRIHDNIVCNDVLRGGGGGGGGGGVVWWVWFIVTF